VAARNLVASDGAGFSPGSEEAGPRQPSNTAPAQAPADARKERRDFMPTKALTLSFAK
jgi:hypothetical protein